MDDPAPLRLPGGAPQSELERALAAARFVVTAEVVPPVSCSAGELVASARPLRGLADAVNVTDNPRARPHLSSLAAAGLLVTAGVEPVMQMVCRDRNRIALQSDLMGAAAMGVHNLLLLGGDPPNAGGEPGAKGVFDTDSLTLTRVAAAMHAEGRLASGRALGARPHFFLGLADIPAARPTPEHLQRLRQRTDAGARFVQTQLCYDAEVVRGYAHSLREIGLTDRLHLLVGVGPLASAGSARWMRENLHGTIIPDRLIARLQRAGDPKAEGITICAELLDAFAQIPGISGAHVMCPADATLIPEAIARSGVRGRAAAGA